MTQFIRAMALALTALSLSGCLDAIDEGIARADQKKTTVSFDGKDLAGYRGSWNSNSTDKWEVALTVAPVNGMTALCGVQAMTGSKLREVTVQRIKDMQLRIGGKRLFQGFNHFTKVPYTSNLSTARATCEVSNVPWQKGYGDGDNWEITSRARDYQL